MKTPARSRWFIFTALLASVPLVMTAQQSVPEPPAAHPGQAISLDAKDPLGSLDAQLSEAGFEQRAPFSAAFAEANRSVDTKLAELRSHGLDAGDEAQANLTSARDAATQAFRDLAFSTKETWTTSRHNALLALRKIVGAWNELAAAASHPQP